MKNTDLRLLRAIAENVNDLDGVIQDALETRKVSADWCECGVNETFGSYPEDGECSCGVHKHHVHCGTCGRISQVG